MKKLNKIHFILIAVLVAVLAVAVFFSFSYQGAEAKQPDIKSEIVQAQMNLVMAQEENDPTELKAQFDELNRTLTLLTRDEPLFPEKPHTVEIGDLIVDSLHKLELTLLKLKSNEEAGTDTIENDDEEVEDNKYNKADFKAFLQFVPCACFALSDVYFHWDLLQCFLSAFDSY